MVLRKSSQTGDKSGMGEGRGGTYPNNIAPSGEVLLVCRLDRGKRFAKIGMQRDTRLCQRNAILAALKQP